MPKYHGPVIPSVLPKFKTERRANQAARLYVRSIIGITPAYIKSVNKKNSLVYKHDKQMAKRLIQMCEAGGK
jgi:hypothetical protein